MADDPTTQIALLTQAVNALTRATEENHREIKQILSDHETRLRTLEKGHTELVARQGTLATINGIYTSILAVLAAAFGKSQ